MSRTLKQVFALILFSLILAGICLLSFLVKPLSESKNASSEPSERLTVIIDAGHGGEDGGSVACDGTEEKELNLLLAKELAAMFELTDVNVVLTREDDRLLYDYYGELDDYKGKKKVYDLKNRSKIAESYNNSLLISIHMNAYPDSRYSGLQVWYPQNSQSSRGLADLIQNSFTELVRPERPRQIKPAGSEMFLLDRATHPAVLVECGFMSNPEELEKLKTREYRQELSAVIFSAVMNFLSDSPAKA